MYSLFNFIFTHFCIHFYYFMFFFLLLKYILFTLEVFWRRTVFAQIVVGPEWVLLPGADFELCWLKKSLMLICSLALFSFFHKEMGTSGCHTSWECVTYAKQSIFISGYLSTFWHRMQESFFFFLSIFTTTKNLLRTFYGLGSIPGSKIAFPLMELTLRFGECRDGQHTNNYICQCSDGVSAKMKVKQGRRGRRTQCLCMWGGGGGDTLDNLVNESLSGRAAFAWRAAWSEWASFSDIYSWDPPGKGTANAVTLRWDCVWLVWRKRGSCGSNGVSKEGQDDRKGNQTKWGRALSLLLDVKQLESFDQRSDMTWLTI